MTSLNPEGESDDEEESKEDSVALRESHFRVRVRVETALRSV